ncbi:MAG: UvrD-helicase domain-containing protein [Spirochaetes bacterium]|nr:UvrD-helicase domain-containing protein [Spirochaetota bacterium]
MKMTLISASAGSGKTWSLTDELYQRITSGEVKPEQVIAVTFTRAAAAELRERVRGRLFEKGMPEAGHRMEGALVGTVHSVCERILKRFAFEAGMSPDFEVIPEGEASMFFNESISSLLGDRGPDLSRLSDAMGRFGVFMGSQLESARKIAGEARSNRIAPGQLADMAKESIRSYFDILPSPLKGDTRALDNELLGGIASAAEALRERIADGSDSTDKTKNYLDLIVKIQARLQRGPLLWNDWAALQAISPAVISAEACARVGAAAARHLSHPLFRRDVEVIITTAYSLAAGALGAYDAWKGERGLIDFIDMEEKVHDLLADERVARTMADEYRLLMVDEFQDTSPLQLALFNRLGKAVGNVAWVGDKKQCIYGFRASDPELMTAAYDAVAGTADIRYLEKSYRSRPQLVAFANKVFTRTFGRLGYAVEEVELEPARTESGELTPPFELWQNGGTNKQADNAMIARGILRLLDIDDPLVIEDPVTGAPRPARPGDIAVLRHYNKDCVNTADELGALGLRTSVARNGLLETPEGVYLASACELVLDQRASLPAAVILYLSRGGSPGVLVNERIREVMAGGGKIEGTPWAGDPLLDGLRTLSGEAGHLSPSELLDRVIETSGLRGLCLRWGGAEFRLGNVDMLRAYARQYEETCGFRGSGASFLGLYLYLRALDAAGEQSSASSPDSVHVSTFHRAKGREWPVVILGDLDMALQNRIRTSEPSAFSSPGSFDFDNPLAGRFIRFWPWPYEERRTTAPLFAAIKEAGMEKTAQERYEREEQRLAYVGVTRARDVLVLPVRRKESKKKKVKDKDKDKEKENTVPKRLRLLDAGIMLPDVSTDGVIKADFGLGETFTVRVRNIDPETPLEAAPSAPGAWFARPEGAPPARRELYLAASRMEGPGDARVIAAHAIGERVPGSFAGGADDPSFGDAAHAFYAADGTDLAREERVAMAAAQLVAHGTSGTIAPEDLVETSDRLAAFIGTRWPGGVTHKEVPVQLRREGQVVIGVADAVVETENELHLIDHKTFPGNVDQCKTRALEYAGQLRAYAGALEKATGKRCATMAVHYPVSGTVVEIG